jgi:preprotein translocase subunit SecE
MNSSFGTIVASKTPAAAFQTLLGLGTGRKSTEYKLIRGARDLNHNRLGVAEQPDNQKRLVGGDMNGKKGKRIVIGYGIAILSALMAAALLYWYLDYAIRGSIEFKSREMTTATVVSVEVSAGSYVVCFSIDGCWEVSANLRSGYEATERKRERTFGPWCEVTVSEAAANLKKGDKLLISFLLANDYEININAVRLLVSI